MSRDGRDLRLGIKPLWAPAMPAQPPRWLRVERDYPRAASTDTVARPLRRLPESTVPLPGFPRMRLVTDGSEHPTRQWIHRTAAHARRYRHHPAGWSANDGGPF